MVIRMIIMFEVIVFPVVNRNIFFVCNIVDLWPEHMPGNVFRVCGALSVSQVEHLPSHKASLRWILGAIKLTLVELKIQEGVKVVVNDGWVVIVLNRVLEAEILFVFYKIIRLFLLILGIWWFGGYFWVLYF